mgnify:CR=1 FL=1
MECVLAGGLEAEAKKPSTKKPPRVVKITTATITLQNVAGTLDGTKRHVITVLDYYISGRGNGGVYTLHADINRVPVAVHGDLA